MTTSPTAEFLSNANEASGLTQRQIAGRAGFAKPNVLSTMKKGETKVPIERISALASACNADAPQFLRIAMSEYFPEMWGVPNLVFDLTLSDREIGLPQMLSIADPEAEIRWRKPEREMVIELFKYILHWLRANGEVAAI